MSQIRSINLPYKVRCELPDCGKPINYVHRIIVDDARITCCSPEHARLAGSRWEEKKKLDVRMGVPVKDEVVEEMTDGNIDEY